MHSINHIEDMDTYLFSVPNLLGAHRTSLSSELVSMFSLYYYLKVFKANLEIEYQVCKIQ